MLGVVPHHRQPLAAAGSRHHVEPRVLELLAHDGTDAVIIVNDENLARPTTRVVVRGKLNAEIVGGEAHRDCCDDRLRTRQL
jgi:hypothetical protein